MPKFVGYQNIELQDDKQALSCGFVSIGANEVDEEGNPVEGIYITDLIPQCDRSNGDIIIEMLNDAGVAIEGQVYSYYVNSRSFADGWWNDYEEQIGEDVDDVFFPAGQGLWVTAFEGATWNNAGQVFDADKGIPLFDDKQMLANPYPTGLSLSENIWVDCDRSNGDVIIEMLNDAGVAIEGQVYSFYVNSRSFADGWWNDYEEQIGEDVDDVVFPAGAGLWVTGFEGATFQITSPIK